MKEERASHKVDIFNKRLSQLPLKNLTTIVTYLGIQEMSHLSLTSKQWYGIVRDPALEGHWVVQSQQYMLSKTGLTGLRNHNLIRLDHLLRDMHMESMQLVNRCKFEQRTSL